MANSFGVVKKAKRNMIAGTINKFVVMLCPFITRTIVQRVIGAQYLGLDSLFSSILTVLSLSEMGISSAIVYCMYKPVAEGDTKAVNAILNFYRKVYRIIGIVVLFLGLCIIPFLPRLITGSVPEGINITLLYLIYLFNTVISYFLFAYLLPLVTANQRDDLNSNRNTLVTLFFTVLRVAVLFLTKSYIYYIALIPLLTITNNIWIAYTVKKAFPELSKCAGNVPSSQIAELKKQVAGTFISKLCGVTRNSLDSIFVSAFLGLSLTAIYNNYYYILSAVITMLSVVSASLIGGIGNHVATRSKDENFNELKRVDFLYLSLAGWCSTCLICLYQPFMRIWMGEQMMLPNVAVVLFVVYFYLLKLGDMRSMYADTSGLFWVSKWRALGESVCNFVLNYSLGKMCGIYGIITATIISLFFCNYIWSVQITFKHYFKRSAGEFYLYQLKYSLVNLGICIVTLLICKGVSFLFSGKVIVLCIRAVVCVVIPLLLYYTFYRKTDNYIYCKKLLIKR